MQQLFFTPTLIVHIAAGFTALFTGLIAIIAKKGLKLHRTNGKIYFWSMLIVAITAAAMSLMKELSFFLMLSMFSFYSSYTGFRVIRNKDRVANWLDWSLLAGAVLTVSFMMVSGNIILMVFGFIFGSFLFSDVRDFLTSKFQQTKSRGWLIIHIARMLAAYIGTVTAFCVVNFSRFFHDNWTLIVWLGPTAIGTPLIFYWINKYTIKRKMPVSLQGDHL
jgi:uncharacterized membrane protein